MLSCCCVWVLTQNCKGGDLIFKHLDCMPWLLQWKLALVSCCQQLHHEFKL